MSVAARLGVWVLRARLDFARLGAPLAWVPSAPGSAWPGCSSPRRVVRRRWLTPVWPEGRKEKRKKEEERRRRGKERERGEGEGRGGERKIEVSGLSGFKSRLYSVFDFSKKKFRFRSIYDE